MNEFGYSEEKLLSKNYEDYVKLVNISEIIKARRMLRDIQVSTYKVTKQDKQERIHRQLNKTAYPENFKRRIIKLDDVNI